jgi:hypothetical protein
MDKELVLYRNSDTHDSIARIIEVIHSFGLDFREVLVDRDPEALGHLLYWTGKSSVPAVIAARPGGNLPYTPPQPATRHRPQDQVDLGSLIAGPDPKQLEDWLIRQRFVMH